MSQKTKIIIFVIALILLVLVLWLVMFRTVETDNGKTTETKTLDQVLYELTSESSRVSIGNQEVSTTVKTKQLSAEEEEKNVLIGFVRDFVERFGTYSNQTDFADVLELKRYMTDNAKPFIDRYVDGIKRKYPYSDGYYGITTIAASVRPIDFSAGSERVQVRISARRQVTSSSVEDVYTQEADVEVVRKGDEWKINGVYWK